MENNTEEENIGMGDIFDDNDKKNDQVEEKVSHSQPEEKKPIKALKRPCYKC